MATKTGVADFYAVTHQLLEQYGNECGEVIQELIPDGADHAVKQLRSDSRKKTGAYAKDWASKASKVSRLGVGYVVYNRKHYRIAHLLENPHVIRNKKGTYGQTVGDGVIAKVEEETSEWMQEEATRRLSGDGW